MSEQHSAGRACQWYGAVDPDEIEDEGAELHLIRGEETDSNPDLTPADPLSWAARGHYDPVRPGTHVAFNR
jgi:hypothetical protein